MTRHPLSSRYSSYLVHSFHPSVHPSTHTHPRGPPLIVDADRMKEATSTGGVALACDDKGHWWSEESKATSEAHTTGKATSHNSLPPKHTTSAKQNLPLAHAIRNPPSLHANSGAAAVRRAPWICRCAPARHGCR